MPFVWLLLATVAASILLRRTFGQYSPGLNEALNKRFSESDLAFPAEAAQVVDLKNGRIKKPY